MTSANVIEYRILKGDTVVGHHRINLMCNFFFEKLLVFLPLSEHTIVPYGYDEEEEYWEDEPQNLEKFLQENATQNKKLKELMKAL
jgi:hypothetical protein